MKVYVVETGAYEQQAVSDVYATLEAAQAAHPGPWDKFIPNSPHPDLRAFWYQEGTDIDITEYEVLARPAECERYPLPADHDGPHEGWNAQGGAVTALRGLWHDYLELAVLAAVALGVAFWLGTTMCPDEPYCPTEDSCVVDYRDGGWDIEEVQP